MHSAIFHFFQNQVFKTGYALFLNCLKSGVTLFLNQFKVTVQTCLILGTPYVHRCKGGP